MQPEPSPTTKHGDTRSLVLPQDTQTLGLYTMAAGATFGLMAAGVPLLAAWSIPAMLLVTGVVVAALLGSVLVIIRRLRSRPRGFTSAYVPGFVGSGVLYGAALVAQAANWVSSSDLGRVAIALVVAAPALVAGVVILIRGRS